MCPVSSWMKAAAELVWTLDVGDVSTSPLLPWNLSSGSASPLPPGSPKGWGHETRPLWGHILRVPQGDGDWYLLPKEP